MGLAMPQPTPPLPSPLLIASRSTMPTRRAWQERYRTKNRYSAPDALATVATGMLNRRAGIGWTSPVHTALPVHVMALGVGASAFTGFYDNTDIAAKIIAASQLKPFIEKQKRSKNIANRP